MDTIYVMPALISTTNVSTLDASLSLASSDTITTNNYVELDTIVGGETIIFYDPTQRTIDVGLYATSYDTQC